MQLIELYNGCMSDTPREHEPLTVRFPRELLERMRELAAQHDRSLNGEIVRAVREYVQRHATEGQG
jgi:predicted transcriptional regulator